MLTEHEIREALRACFDASNPFKRPLNIVDLGLVESITLDNDNDAPGAGIPGVPTRQTLALTLIPTSSDESHDDANAILVAQIQNRLAGLPELSRTSVQLLDTPTWTPSRISPKLRKTLKLDPPAFPILNNR